jgi:rhamnosyltransferase
MNGVRVSVCLPVWQGVADLRRLLPALARQRVEGGFEVVAIDSSSTDGSFELLRDHGARVERIAQSEFGHGRTRNRLARLARGELLVYLSQDALPVGDDFLAALVRPLAEDGVAAATARILPRDDDDPLTRRSVLDQPQASTLPRRHALKEGGLRMLSPAERAARVAFDNVAAAYRAEVLAALPFPELPFGEDAGWAESALQAGHVIAFEPEAVVLHAHRYDARSAWVRWRQDAAFQRVELGRRVRPGLASVLRGLAFELRRDWNFLRREGRLGHLPRALLLRSAQVGGAWAGSRGRIGPSGVASGARHRAQ